MMIEAAATGQGVALGSPRIAARWLKSGALIRLYDIEASCPYSYYLVRRRKGESAEAELVVQWLQELVARDPLGDARAPKKELRVVRP